MSLKDQAYVYDGVDPEQLDHPKSRNFFVRTYNSLQTVESMLANKTETIKHCHYIVHNQDLVKSRHIHLVIVTVGVTTADTIYGWFKDCLDDNNRYGNTFVQYANDIRYCYQYLVHANDPEKERYDVAEIRHMGSSRACIEAIESIPEFSASARCYKEYVSGASPKYLAQKYGAVFLRNYMNYNKARQEDNRLSAVEETLKALREELSFIGAIANSLDISCSVGDVVSPNVLVNFLDRVFICCFHYLDKDYSSDGRFK